MVASRKPHKYPRNVTKHLVLGNDEYVKLAIDFYSLLTLIPVRSCHDLPLLCGVFSCCVWGSQRKTRWNENGLKLRGRGHVYYASVLQSYVHSDWRMLVDAIPTRLSHVQAPVFLWLRWRIWLQQQLPHFHIHSSTHLKALSTSQANRRSISCTSSSPKCSGVFAACLCLSRRWKLRSNPVTVGQTFGKKMGTTWYDVGGT